MGVTRRIIFPTIRLLLWAVIAAALVKIAFAGAELDGPVDALVPTGAVAEPTVQAETGTITNAVTVQGSVVADPAVAVRATLAGAVSKVLVADGAAVQAGTPLLEIRQETPQEPLVRTDPVSGEQVTTERKPKVTVEVVKAPVAGTLAMPTLKDQVVAVGDEVGTVSPGSLSVSGTLTPEQQYRLVGAPATAQVTLNGGPAPFECTGLRVGAASTGAGADQGEDAGTTPASGTLTCAVPAGVTAFAGLGATLDVVNGEATDAVVVPVTAVQGIVQNGNVWVVTKEGAEPEQRAVKLGLTDGRTVQITEGLAVGDTVLQFIPVPGGAGEVDCNDPSQFDPAVCGG
ncbi:efflux RND transporter periplasmic adaptor subunit [Cellulomonas fimi]|uniref:Secretion protein HlyD family protein n=1 Tax=Cellulomonas fimi (strain ATCC 484 / DSM 20113 / JCM 1341 / CCUG 24087 / LMG 16345 / NBRC 15513 / NCIMB 8980 / NCTC 7547 / NRS-133) TaxID=590998 RepID=F4H362_CELFA|nr:secretion protein HlyD [Cellulomonas fimi]AEE45283.1 secretion protein HlyD family protein [Cellulomonas fimi ATCC 484]NNH08028.1 secretion protein HlyD [Cellulomonas fimi]VEH28805.1 efflux transporter, RND family, MFP subunit [Cellulomonas fimi]